MEQIKSIYNCISLLPQHNKMFKAIPGYTSSYTAYSLKKNDFLINNLHQLQLFRYAKICVIIAMSFYFLLQFLAKKYKSMK